MGSFSFSKLFSVLPPLFIALSVFTQISNAELSPSGQCVEFAGWKYIPIMEDDVVHSIVVLSIDSQVQDSKITSMWFVHTENSWSEFAWRTTNQREALSDIKDLLNLEDATDYLWPVEPELIPDGTVPTSSKEPISSGLFQDDPWLPIVEAQENPTTLLTALVTAGWQASDASLFESTTRKDQLLNDLSTGFLLELQEEGSGLDTFMQGTGTGNSCHAATYYGWEKLPVCQPLGGWYLVYPCSTTQPMTGGGCQYNNCWSRDVKITQQRSVLRWYSDCTTCYMTQTRSVTCSTIIYNTVDQFLGVCAGIPPGPLTEPTPIPAPCDLPRLPCADLNLTVYGPHVDSVCPILY